MKLDSVGILINLRPLNERDAIARIFSRDFGVLGGVLRGALVTKKNKPLVGQVGNVVWNARIDSQVGVFHWDAEKNFAVHIMSNSDLLMRMNSAFDLLVGLLPERAAYEGLYENTCELLFELAQGNKSAYLNWEINLLRELGYALDLTACAGCGCGDNLNYLSPRTGRAVCNNCAMPYINKLYRLPVNLNITLRFLENVFDQQGGGVPVARRMLVSDI